MSVVDYEALVRHRNLLLATIADLERGLLEERRKRDLYLFEVGRGAYDDAALREQAARCDEGAARIGEVLADERAKLSSTEAGILASHQVLAAHGVTTCILGVEPHEWVVTQRHPSGAFARRHCARCERAGKMTEERVGYS